MSEDAEGLVEGLVVKPAVNGRRTFSTAAKCALVLRCAKPGVSVAQLALLHGINANLLRRWVVQYGTPRRSLTADRRAQTAPATLLPVTTPMQSVPRTPGLSESYIEIALGSATIRVRGAVDAALLDVVLECLGRRS